MNQITIEEWFAKLCVAREKAKEAISDEFDEYADFYEDILQDIDDNLRRSCRKFTKLAFYAKLRREKEKNMKTGENNV